MALSPEQIATLKAQGVPDALIASLNGSANGIDYSTALQDPEYQLADTQINADQANAQAQYGADQTNIQAQYGSQLRDVQQALPGQQRRATESAAGRGMLYSGGQLEEQGQINQENAGQQAQIGQNQATDLNGLLMAMTRGNSGRQGQRTNSLQSAAQRASERARDNPIAPTAEPVGVEASSAPTQQPVYMPPQSEQQPNPMTGITAPGNENGFQIPTTIRQSGDNQTTLPQIQAATGTGVRTLNINGTQVTTNAAGIINTRGPYYGRYPAQVGGR